MPVYDPVVSAVARDSEGHPIPITSSDGDMGEIQPYRDENSEITKGGIIGWYLAYGLLFAVFAGFYLTSTFS